MKGVRYGLLEASRILGVEQRFLVQCLEARWVVPVSAGDPATIEPALDEEDIARARLIHELMDELGANAESIPIILHLLDQLYYLRSRAA